MGVTVMSVADDDAVATVDVIPTPDAEAAVPDDVADADDAAN
jgi:hypothetical protein